MTIPVGDSSNFLKIGPGINLSLHYRFPAKPLFFVGGGLGYNYFSLQADPALSVITATLDGGMIYNFTPKFGIKGFGKGGFYSGFLTGEITTEDARGSDLYFSLGAGVFYGITPSLELGILSTYENYLDLMNGIGVSLGLVYNIGIKRKARLELQEINLDTVFPVFYKYYDDHPIGTVTLRNDENTPVSGITVSFYVKQYMDSPRVTKVDMDLDKNSELEVELNALLTEEVLEITEGTKVTADIEIHYLNRGKRQSISTTETLRLHDRNAMTWDDDRKAAAFVTSKDPNVLSFSKNIAGMVRDSGYKAIDENLRMAMGMHEALSEYGISYVVDPKTPYAELSQKTYELDYLQFPKQTMEYSAGDCDDLSILYCALLESIGIETAFVTTPGHIFMAFSLDDTPEVVRKSSSNQSDYIFKNGRTWVPIEVTERSGGFSRAWKTGASQWREHSEKDQAGFFEIHDAWETYEPVGLPGGGTFIVLPNMSTVMSMYERELRSYIDREISIRVVKLQNEIKKSGYNKKPVNKLGVLYARYGLTDKAKVEFDTILQRDARFVPALLNMGNLNYLDGRMEDALAYYERALKIDNDNPNVILCVARANHALNNFGLVTKYYAQLQQISPEHASRFDYLGQMGEESTRASETDRIKGLVYWEE
jgi:tetratricopeptide (TPR) repeat protein